MSEKMLKFVTTKGQTPEKSSVDERVKISPKYIKTILLQKLKNNQADARSVGFRIVKFIVHYQITFLTG